MVDARSPAFLKIGCRALTFHIFKNLRLFDKKIVAGLQNKSQFCAYLATFHNKRHDFFIPEFVNIQGDGHVNLVPKK